MVIELMGGPLDGVIHEVFGTLTPDRIGLPIEQEPGRLAWYRVDDFDSLYRLTATFERTEDRK